MPGTATFNEEYPITGGVTVDEFYTPGSLLQLMGRAEVPWRVDVIFASSTDTVDNTLFVITQTADPASVLVPVVIPAGSGTDGTHPVVNVLGAAITPLQGGLALPAGANLYAMFPAAPSTGTKVTVSAYGGTL